MSWITPLGFLGLLSIAVLVLIYIIKPNYQQKVVSSTHVWRLSLKYRKKRLPINRFRNILLFLCQILILTACAFMLAQPIIAAQSEERHTEKIIIIDSSASMLATRADGKTRFAYAVEQVAATAEDFLQHDGVITVIAAGKNASVVVAPRLNSRSVRNLTDAVKELQCTYGEADVEGAMDLAQDVLRQNPEAEVVFYTGTQYIDKGGITVVDVSQDGSWNAAILDCRAELNDNLYSFTVDLACYGRDTYVNLYCDVFGVGEENQTVSMSAYVKCSDDKTQAVEFSSANEDGMGRISSYDYVYVHVEENDSFSHDNSFYLYGGKKETVRVQYYSTNKNPFFQTALLRLQTKYRSTIDIEIQEVDKGEPVLEGFDIYIFEHKMPETVPTDGIVWLVNPDRIPEGVDMVLGEEISGEFDLSLGQQHPVIDYMRPENIGITLYKRIISSDGYDSLLYCGGDPVLLLKNEVNCKIAVLSFSLNNATLAIRNEFPVLMLNFFKYFLPGTFTGNVFDVNEAVALNARGPVLTVSGPGTTTEISAFPDSLSLSTPGIYTVSQSLLGVDADGNPRQLVENFYVKIPSEQSNICRSVDVLTHLYIEPKEKSIDKDLLVFFAAALVALLFIEWLLQSREQF